MSRRKISQTVSYEDATKGVADEVEDFLLDATELEEGEYLDQLFSEEETNEFEFNSQNMETPSEIGTMYDQVGTPDAPGSNDMTGPFMHLDSLPDVVNTTENEPMAPIEDIHALEVLEYDEANMDEDIEFFDDEDFEFNTAEMETAGQPLAQHSTQPPPGVTNMMGGSVSNSGGNQSNIETRTEGGTTGTTPDSAPASKGYGQPSIVTQANEEELDLNITEEDILPDDDEMMINEFDSLL